MELLTQLGINWPLLIAQTVNFMIVLGVLTALVYRPLLNLIEERRERVRRAMEQAEQSEAEAVKMAERRREHLKHIDEEGGLLLAEARRKAERLREQTLEQARREAAAIVEQGRTDLTRERAEALREIQDTLGQAVVALTQKLLEREWSEADQKNALQKIADDIPALLK
jgi:F-type H+-transporting ATPase subunit b